MNELERLRKEIDRIDEEMQRLFLARMEAVRDVAAYKALHGLGVADRDREAAVIAANVGRIGTSPFAPFYRAFLEQVMSVSKDYQKTIVRDER